MNKNIRKKIRTSVGNLNTWAFTGLAIVLAIILTTLLNSIFARINGTPINPRVFMFATIDAILIPLIIAPIIINMFKRVINLEEEKQNLEGQVAHHQYAQDAADHRIANLKIISDLAIECASAAPSVDLNKLLAEKLQVYTGALGVSISEYHEQEQVLITRHVAVSGEVLSTINKALGQNIIGLRSPVSSEIFQRMTKEVVAVASDLYEVTFGAVPKSVSTIVKNTLGIDSFTGLALFYSGKLWGTAVIVMRKGHLPIDRELAMALANVAAMAMHRQKAEEALQESEYRYQAILQSQKDMIIRFSPNGRITFVNEACCKFYGKTPNDFLGTYYLDNASPELRQYVSALVAKLSPQTPVLRNENENIDACGNTHWFYWINQAIFNDAGQITEYQSIGRDITELKQAEVEREKLISQLKFKNDELEQFSYTVSHDLKAPLITVGGFINYLEADMQANNPERVKKDIEQINKAIKKMARLLNEILELSRIGRMMNTPEDIPFEKILQEALELAGGRLNEKNIEVRFERPLSTVHGDHTRLVQVLQNLIDNAAKFMGDQSHPIIEIGQNGEEDGMPIFYVRDNGMGIAPEHHKRIFEIFNKLDTSAEGTGIGLSLVKKIVEVHGGRIWVESDPSLKGEPEEGSTFYFTLPTE